MAACPSALKAWAGQPWPASAKHKAIPLVPEVYLETDKGNFTNVLLITRVLYMSFDRFLLAVESRDLYQADKSIIRVSSFPNLSDG